MQDAERVRSPHCDRRPHGAEISLLIIHGISLPAGQYGGPYIDQLFTGTLDAAAHPNFADIAALPVSAHVLIRRDGRFTQYVPFDMRAWHAGQSSFQGCPDCNDFSIGVELEGCDADPYEPIQYRRAAELARALMRRFPAITRDRIAGHSEVAPGRKTDPGQSFDWNQFHALLAEQEGSRA